jgi:hypothetical protein
MEWLLRGMGLFYTLAGVAYARHFALDGAMDKMLEALEGPPPAKEKIKSYWLKTGAALTVASGLALLTLSWWIVPLMIANAIVQGAWLAYARRAFPPEDEAEARGRRQTTNAFLIWLIATAIALIAVWGAGSPVVPGLVQDWLPPLGGAIFLGWMVMQ